jgi:hypothetical protein
MHGRLPGMASFHPYLFTKAHHDNSSRFHACHARSRQAFATPFSQVTNQQDGRLVL